MTADLIGSSYADCEDIAIELAERILAFRSQVADYDVIIAQASDVPIPPHVASYLRASESGPALAYYLAKRIPLFQEIVTLPADEALNTLADLESKLDPPQYDMWAAVAAVAIEQQRIDRMFSAREAAFSAAVPRYRGAAEAFEQAQVPGCVVDYIQKSEIGPQVLYYLGMHVGLLTDLVALPQHKALSEIQRLDHWIRDLLTLQQWTPPAGCARN